MTRVSETILDEDGEQYEQRFSVWLVDHEMKFVRRPISIEPPEGTVALVDNGPRHGTIRRRGAGVFKDGKWRQVGFTPLHWVSLDGK